MENINKQIEELQKKAVKYDNMKGRHVEQAQRLKHIIKDLQTLLNDIDPANSVSQESSKRGRGSGDLTPIINELYNLLLNGTHITSKLISNTYSNLNEKQISYIMSRIQKNKNVIKVKEGIYVRLFINKEI